MSAPSEITCLPFRHDANAEMNVDPFAIWNKLRDQHGTFLSDQANQPLWYLLRYDDVYAALRDDVTFSARAVVPGFRQEGIPPGCEAGDEKGMKFLPLQMDPPEHPKYRHLLNPLLSPSRIDLLEPSIRAHCVRLIDEIRQKPEVEFVHEFAQRYSTTIFIRLVQRPVEEGIPLLGWIHDMFGARTMDGSPEELRARATRAIEGVASLFRYLGEIIEDRRRYPLEDDLVTDLLQAKVDGAPIPDDILGQLLFLLFTGGLDTVVGHLSYALMHFATHPDDRQRLIDQPELVPTAVEECLRYYTIVTNARVVRDDALYAGCPMKGGDRIAISLAAANRDPRQFPRADEFDLERSPNRHLAFGMGRHRCVGSHLARREMHIALEEWHRLIPHYSIADGAELIHHVGSVAGLDALPLVLHHHA